MQQCLPFTVLKRNRRQRLLPLNYWVATVHKAKLEYIQKQVATVLTVYGIETTYQSLRYLYIIQVATVLTVYGIETHKIA